MNKPLTGILAVTAPAGAADIQAYDWQSAKENLSAKRSRRGAGRRGQPARVGKGL